jgi:CubicO group peptidase (beta-lactamase class C family)
VTRVRSVSIGLFTLGLLIALCARGAESYWPTHSWRRSTPEAQGFDSQTLASALRTIRQRELPIHSLLIERNGYLILETYFFPFKEGERHDLASATKSITSTLIGIAIGEGRLAGVEQPALSLFSDSSVSYRDARKERMTIEDFLTMRSGLDCVFAQGELTLKQMRASTHWVPFMLNLRMTSDPGSTWVYCSGGMHVLSGIISKVTGRSAFAFARERLFAPLDIRDASWPSDPDGVSDGWGDLQLRPRDMAKIGYLWLHEGNWAGQQIVPAEYMRSATQPHSHMPEYGYGFWIYQDHPPAVLKNMGRTFEAQGRGGQRIWVSRKKNMVVVTTGGGFEPADVAALVFPALKSDGQLPPNSSGDAQLTAASLVTAKPPRPHLVQPLPSLARLISGKIYLLDKNELGLKSISLDFTRKPAIISIGLVDGRSETRPVGLDGIPRVSPSHNMSRPFQGSIDGFGDSPVAVSGTWEDGHTFTLAYNTIGSNQDYQMGLIFRDQQVEVKLGERTGLIDEKVRGYAP